MAVLFPHPGGPMMAILTPRRAPKVTLKAKQTQGLLRRHEMEMKGREGMESWVLQNGLKFRPSAGKAFAFWYDLKGYTVLPDAAVVGLQTAVHIAKFEVVLLTYQNFENIPSGVVVKSATEYLAEATFKSALQAAHVALLSDYVRLRATVADGSAYDWRVVFLDCDTVWLKDMTSYNIEGTLGDPDAPQGIIISISRLT